MVLFIQPRVNPASQYPLINKFIYASFPTGLGFLAGYLREKNLASVKIVDENIDPLNDENLTKEIKSLKHPKIIGISVLTINSKRAFQLAKNIKEIDSNITIVLGGVHPTVLPEECLKEGVDVIVRGEGEVTLSELYDAIANDIPISKIKGISYREGTRIIHNPDRELTPLDDIPLFPYDLFEKNLNKYRDFGTIITSRGCPYNCIFCSQRAISGGKYRFVPSERIIEELNILINKYHQKNILFMDDNLSVNKKRLIDLCNAIIDNGFHKKAGFIAQLRGDSVDYELLRKMKKANFVLLSFGSETTSERLMKIIDKQETPEDNMRAIRMAHELGFKTSTTFIFGIPTETRAERLKTIRDASKLPLDSVRFNIAVPYPGTRLYDIAKRNGLLSKKNNWHNFNVQYYVMGDDIPYVPEGVNRDLLMYDTMRANLMFHLSWHGIKNIIKAPISGSAVTLPDSWYLSPITILRIFGLFFYIAERFLFLFIRAFFIQLSNKLKGMITKK